MGCIQLQNLFLIAAVAHLGSLFLLLLCELVNTFPGDVSLLLVLLDWLRIFTFSAWRRRRDRDDHRSK